VGGTRAPDVHQRRSPSVVVGLPADQVQAQRLHGYTVRLPCRPRQALLLQTILRSAHRHTVVRFLLIYVHPGNITRVRDARDRTQDPRGGANILRNYLR